MIPREFSTPWSRALWPVAASALALLAFFAVGRTFLESFRLDLGAAVVPAIRHTYFLFFWTILGSVAAALLAVGLIRLQALSARSAAPSGRRPAPSARSRGRSCTRSRRFTRPAPSARASR